MYYVVITMLMTIFIVKMMETEMLEMENMVVLSTGLDWVGGGSGHQGHGDGDASEGSEEHRKSPGYCRD